MRSPTVNAFLMPYATECQAVSYACTKFMVSHESAWQNFVFNTQSSRRLKNMISKFCVWNHKIDWPSYLQFSLCVCLWVLVLNVLQKIQILDILRRNSLSTRTWNKYSRFHNIIRLILVVSKWSTSGIWILAVCTIVYVITAHLTQYSYIHGISLLSRSVLICDSTSTFG